MPPDPNQATPPDPHLLRYSDRPFPPYRFIPGLFPHPRRDPHGHSFGQPEPDAERVAPDQWMDSECYCYGVDLFNYGYWWECHEQFEALWHAVGHESEQGLFLQGIVQIAAACLQRFMKSDTDAGIGLMSKGIARLRRFRGVYMGLDVPAFVRDVEEFFSGVRRYPPVIDLRQGTATGETLWGLCASCRHAQTIRSARGSAFVRCRMSITDKSFPKYPVLPVRACTGYNATPL